MQCGWDGTVQDRSSVGGVALFRTGTVWVGWHCSGYSQCAWGGTVNTGAVWMGWHHSGQAQCGWGGSVQDRYSVGGVAPFRTGVVWVGWHHSGEV